MKRYIEDQIEEIAKETGYTWDFLMDRYNELVEDMEPGDPDPLEEVRSVAREKDF
ncbi:MAG: hypothetical protein PHC95_05010 [Parabacteroides sp.]|nr:hypothetical protein [Parabacteroides sp.]